MKKWSKFVRPGLLALGILASAGYAFAGEEAKVNCCGKHDGDVLCRWVDTDKKNCTVDPNSCTSAYPVCCENTCKAGPDEEME